MHEDDSGSRLALRGRSEKLVRLRSIASATADR
jgi:hypothetical protein